jgi:hypothetical protein
MASPQGWPLLFLSVIAAASADQRMRLGLSICMVSTMAGTRNTIEPKTHMTTAPVV